MKINPIAVARSRFVEVFRTKHLPAVSFAPGRVNIIGEHTDYNDGFVLPMAIDRGVAVAFAPRNDRVIRAHSVVFGEMLTADIAELQPPGGYGWFDYAASVVWAMRDEGVDVGGIDMAVDGNVPVGAGLASSAAMEMAVARALCHAASIEWDPVRMAILCQRAENRYVGVNCGIMDQFAASASVVGSALLLDCRTLEYSFVSIPPEATFVVMDTGVRRTLATSEYNDRRSSCETAVEVLHRFDSDLSSLRDVDLEALTVVGGSLDDKVLRRATHVVNEIGRPQRLADALMVGDLDRAGNLMDESHASLRDLYEVSCIELDLITAIARECDGCYGARMTGAGFGGCAIALVESDQASRFVAVVSKEYSAAGQAAGAMYICQPSAGAAIVQRSAAH